MKIKNQEWIDFKERLISILSTLEQENEKIDFSDDPDNFELVVDGVIVHPIFSKKTESLRVEYDLSLCNTKIRYLSFSLYRDTGRIEITLKNEENQN